MSAVGRVLRIQTGEGRIAVLGATLALVSMASFTIGESGIDALFFDRVGASALPVMYILQGVTTFVVMLALTGVLGRLGHRRSYLLIPLALGILLLVEWAIVKTGVAWIFRVLWITDAVAALLLAVAIWGTAGAVTDTRQAKRLFPLFAAGGILGSVIGGLVTRPLAPVVGAENLLLVWVGGLALASLLTRLILGRGGAARQRRTGRRGSAMRDLRQSFAFVRRSSLLTWMTVAAVLFSVLFYLLYLPYARAASEHFPDANALAAFFGLFWATVTAAAFLVSILLTNRLFAWIGVAAMIVVLPVLYLGAFAILLVTSGFVTLVVIRFAMGTWLQGVASPAWETLTNVVPESRRDQTRAFLNGGPAQVGTVIAGVLALGQNALTLRQFATIGLVAAVVTIVAAIGIRRSYTGALVDALRTGRPQVFDRPAVLGAPTQIDLAADAVQALAASTQSSDVRERRLAYQLLAEVPAADRPDQVVEGTGDEDPLVRLSVARALDPLTPEGQGALMAMLHDPDPSVAAAAAVAALHGSHPEVAEARLRRLLGDPDEGNRLAAVEQLDRAPSPMVGALSRELARDSSGPVRAAALERLAAAASGDDVLERALDALHDVDPAVRMAAGRALGVAGGPAIESILDAFEDPSTEGAAVEGIRRMQLNGNAEHVRAFVVSAATQVGSDRTLAAMIPSENEPTLLLRDAVLDRGRRRARSALWAATLLGPRRTAMEAALENLDGGPGQVATALETLEAAGEPALVRPLIALWEPVAPEPGKEWLSRALNHHDAFIVRCAEFVRAYREGEAMADAPVALSEIERVLFLRNVSLFADLTPQDLDRVAKLVEERAYVDSDVIAAQGEIGEELHIVLEGSIRVVQGLDGSERQIATRSSGEVVGEMSIITREPRIASLVAAGDVRTISLRCADFEGMLRERPDIGLAVMRVLAYRLAEVANAADEPVSSSGPA